MAALYWAILSLALIFLLGVADGKNNTPIFSEFADLPITDDGHLSDHWLLYTNTPECTKATQEAWRTTSPPGLRKCAAVEGKLSLFFFSHEESLCSAVVLEKGTAIDLISYPLPERLFNMDGGSLYSDWLRSMQVAEVGFVSYMPHSAIIYWLDPTNGERANVGLVKYGASNPVWLETYLGHQFEVVSEVTGEVYGRYTIEHNSFLVIGGRASMTRPMDVASQLEEIFDAEWSRSHIVKRTFTEIGFDRRRLPLDLWASLQTYYYNNRNNAVREEWEGKGYYVNWWEVDAYKIVMPSELKKYWQRRLMALVEEWTGVELELTDIYGMRRYEDGARLVTHVDRHQTHAASMIINVAQHAIREPWKVEIYDFADRLHEVEMAPGDLVFYESARCLHGRMKPLQGGFYVNLFVHFRPKDQGDNWFTQEIPANGTKALLDIGVCQATTTGNSSSTTCSKGHSLPFLSPALETLRGGEDLFRWWQQTGNVERKVRGVMVKPDELAAAAGGGSARSIGSLSREL